MLTNLYNIYLYRGTRDLLKGGDMVTKKNFLQFKYHFSKFSTYLSIMIVLDLGDCGPYRVPLGAVYEGDRSIIILYKYAR